MAISRNLELFLQDGVPGAVAGQVARKIERKVISRYPLTAREAELLQIYLHATPGTRAAPAPADAHRLTASLRNAFASSTQQPRSARAVVKMPGPPAPFAPAPFPNQVDASHLRQLSMAILAEK
jgi:hypothetical protein